MVLCKRNERETDWNAFGLLGEGCAGKSTISFILARLLVEKDSFIVKSGTSLKVIDDNFTLDNGVVSSDDWGGDKLGKLGKQQQFVDFLADLGHSHCEARPNKGKFHIGTFIGWLLISGNMQTYAIMRSNRDEFIEKLLDLNPCHGKTDDHPTSPSQEEINSQPEVREQIRASFDPSWEYSTVTRKNTRSREDEPLLEILAQKAYDVWHSHPTIFDNQKGLGQPT